MSAITTPPSGESGSVEGRISGPSEVQVPWLPPMRYDATTGKDDDGALVAGDVTWVAVVVVVAPVESALVPPLQPAANPATSSPSAEKTSHRATSFPVLPAAPCRSPSL